MPVPPLNIAVYGTGHVDPVSSTTFHALATSAPEGIYTAAGLRKVDAGWAVVDWVLHLARLKLSLEVMHEKGRRYYDMLFDWISQQGEEGLEEALRTKLNPLVKQALAALAESGWEGDAMLTLLIQDIQAKGGSDSVNNGMDSNSMDSDASTAPVNVKKVKSGSDSVNNGMNRNGTSSDVMSSNGMSSAAAPVNVWVFISFVTVPKRDVPVPVCVMGAPRPASDAHAKYALWIEQRRGLEARKPEGVGEILLADNNGLITEGLVTNFFVVVEMQEDAGSSASSQPVVMTAGEGALYGILRRRVEDACNRIGIPLLHQAPQSGERASWQEAFVTNCIRGVQPVSRVYCPEDNHWQHEPWEHSLPQPYGPITQAVQHALRSVQQLTFETDL
eukprot:gene29027-32224_t